MNFKSILIILTLLLPVLGAAGAAAAPATNAYGYVVTLPAFPGARTFTGNSLLLVDDQMSGALPIGFDFVFGADPDNANEVLSWRTCGKAD